MKNRLFSFVVFFFLLFSFATPAFADDFPVSVYGAPGEQRQVMECIEKSEEVALKLLKLRNTPSVFVEESIMPIYLADLIDFSQEGVFRITRWENHYVAQHETKDGVFEGVAILLVENGTAKVETQLLSKEVQEALHPELGIGKTTCSPCSYSYHKDFIQKTFGDDVTEQDVCYLVLSEGRGGNGGFLVKGKNGNPDALLFFHDNQLGETERSIRWIDDKLKIYADEKREAYEKELAEIEAWKKAHPGEDYPYVGGTVGGTVTNNQEKRSVVFPIIGASVLAGTGIFVVIFVAAKKRKRVN